MLSYWTLRILWLLRILQLLPAVGVTTASSHRSVHKLRTTQDPFIRRFLLHVLPSLCGQTEFFAYMSGTPATNNARWRVAGETHAVQSQREIPGTDCCN